jgi:hypothetical protein
MMRGVAGRQAAGAAERQRHSARRARLVGLAGFAGATALPFVLWHRAIWMISSEFRLDSEYLVSGWTGYTLIGLGLLFMAPVVASIGRNPDSRLYPRSRNAYFGWGVSLYLLGLALAAQVATIARDHSLP